MPGGGRVVGFRGKVFEQDGEVWVEGGSVAELSREVHLAETGAAFLDLHGGLPGEGDVLKVDGERGAVDSVEQSEVVAGGVGVDPGHGFEGVGGAPGSHGVDDLADGADDQVEGVVVEVGGVGAVPLVAPAAGDVDAAARAGLLGEGEAADALFDGGVTDGVVGGDGV